MDFKNTAGGVQGIPIPDTTPEQATISLLDQEEPQDFRFTLTDEQRKSMEAKLR